MVHPRHGVRRHWLHSPRWQAAHIQATPGSPQLAQPPTCALADAGMKMLWRRSNTPTVVMPPLLLAQFAAEPYGRLQHQAEFAVMAGLVVSAVVGNASTSSCSNSSFPALFPSLKPSW